MPRALGNPGAVSALAGGGLVAMLALASWPGAAVALPADPQRPFQAQSCDAALARLAEARAGSPLIGAAEAAEVLRRAADQARRLCGPEYDMQTGPPGAGLPRISGD